MPFMQISKKGIGKFFLGPGVDPDSLSLHISEAEAGGRLHPPHTHSGLEGFYMIDGQATVETENGSQPIGPGECAIVDATTPHGLVNTGTTKMRYIVIIAK
jgi:quercetin dioxygenase-like cupin family protein